MQQSSSLRLDKNEYLFAFINDRLSFPSLSCFWFHISNNKDTVLKGEMSFFEYNSMAAAR